MGYKNHNIKVIYSLGDIIGFDNLPSECLKLIIENNIINILGNVEKYVIFGGKRIDEYNCIICEHYHFLQKIYIII